MKREETTKEKIVRTLNTCYERSWTSDGFFGSLNQYGIETYEENGQVEGVVIDGAKVSLSSLGYTPETIQSLDPPILSEEDLALIDEYRHQMKEQENVLRASDIVPNWEQLEREMERADGREDELDDIRAEEGDEKDIDKGLER